MSEDQIETDESQEFEKDQSQNLKAEFNRKFQNLQEVNSKLTAQNEELTSKMDAILSRFDAQTAQAAPKEDLEDLKYTDPDKYVELREKELENRVLDKVSQTQQAETKKQQVLAQLAGDYPAIADPNSAIYKRAIEIGKNYDKSFIATAEGVQLAVREAAAQLGIMPASVKNAAQHASGEQSMSEFIGGSGGSGDGTNRSSKKDKSDLDPKTVVVAELMGLDVNDKKTIERLRKHNERSKRKSWGRWE